jgi:hypothetical protein
MQNRDGPATYRVFGDTKYKKTTGTSDEALEIACAIGTRLAQLSATATATPYSQIPKSALDLRLRILDSGAQCVNLKSLLEYSWSIGIPVVFLAKLPNANRHSRGKAEKMHGMTVIYKGRPAVVLAKNAKKTAWLLFILAHELGHIASGHLSEGTSLVDQNVQKNEVDAEEEQANKYAIELLTGRPDYRVVATGTWPSADSLAASSIELGKRDRVDPGHVALNYAHSMGSHFWSVAQEALKKIEPNANAPALIRSFMASKLDWSALPAESSRYVLHVTESET